MRRIFVLASLFGSAFILCLGLLWSWSFLLLLVWLPLLILGYLDYFQISQAIRRNYPLLGRLRYLFEAIRPEINQYFVESNSDGVPFSREQRSVVYQRAKGQIDTLPFGTQQDVYGEGYEWIAHSLAPTKISKDQMRLMVGEKNCKKPYSASLLNISAMSYGSLSKNAVLALNGGAKLGGFAHNTGEGDISEYHLKYSGDLIWQIGTGYFGCRGEDGKFSEKNFETKAQLENIKMIEIKLSQGAKPAHGGILPAAKVTEEIARIRGVKKGEDVISPPAHSAFSNPTQLMHFIKRLRELSGSKPVGFKLALGEEYEFIAICKAMVETGITPDFISVDGGEGGTGAAPPEFSNHVGYPGLDALVFVHNALVGFGLREDIRIFNSGKINSGFGMLKRIALGADAIYAARSMMLALGCIQALKCNTNHCPAGVATQDPNLVAGLVVSDKRVRIASFHKETIHNFKHLTEAMGLNSPSDLRPWHIFRRGKNLEVKNYAQIYSYLDHMAFLGSQVPSQFKRVLEESSSSSFKKNSLLRDQSNFFKKAS